MCCVKSRMTVLYEDIAGVASCGLLAMHHTHSTTQHTHTQTHACAHIRMRVVIPDHVCLNTHSLLQLESTTATTRNTRSSTLNGEW